VLIWHREDPKTAPFVLQGHEASVNGVALSREGRWLISGQGDGTLWIGTMSATDLQAKACKFAARNLSGAEWQLYLSDEPYRETCPGQPRPDKYGRDVESVDTFTGKWLSSIIATYPLQRRHDHRVHHTAVSLSGE
jgi:hypothetical protein